MNTTLEIAEAKSRRSEAIDRVLAGETIVVARNGEPVVELRPVRRVAPDDAVARIRAIGERICERNEAEAPLLEPGQTDRGLMHEGHKR